MAISIRAERDRPPAKPPDRRRNVSLGTLRIKQPITYDASFVFDNSRRSSLSLAFTGT